MRLLLQRAATNRAQTVKNEHVLACGAKGSRTPDLLHAMQQEQRSGLGLNSSDLDLLCPGVPVSACKSVCVGCPLGCPLVFDHILPATSVILV
jgi:hypothetical protein